MTKSTKNTLLVFVAVSIFILFSVIVKIINKPQTRPPGAIAATDSNPAYRAAQYEWDTYKYANLADLTPLTPFLQQARSRFTSDRLPEFENFALLTKDVLRGMVSKDAGSFIQTLETTGLAPVLHSLGTDEVRSTWELLNPGLTSSYWRGVAWEPGSLTHYKVLADALFDAQRFNTLIIQTQPNAGASSHPSAFGRESIKIHGLPPAEMDALLLTFLFDCQPRGDAPRVKRPVSIEFIYHPSAARWIPSNISINFAGGNHGGIPL